ncbi:CBS domain-containing protein [Leptolyngbya sp. CCNP1308]|nr:CBS domain-containing protein [Leptolyngbya sp. CCNP1308]
MANGSQMAPAPADFSGRPDDLRVGDLVDGLPPVITPQVSVQAAAQILRDRALSCLVVADGATVLGLFTEREVLRAVATGGRCHGHSPEPGPNSVGARSAP